jgi:hypothetical protein
MMRLDLARDYNLNADDRMSLLQLVNGGKALEATEKLFAEHRIRSNEPSEFGRKAADLALLVLGALVGAVAQKHLAPPPTSALSGFSFDAFVTHESLSFGGCW